MRRIHLRIEAQGVNSINSCIGLSSDVTRDALVQTIRQAFPDDGADGPFLTLQCPHNEIAVYNTEEDVPLTSTLAGCGHDNCYFVKVSPLSDRMAGVEAGLLDEIESALNGAALSLTQAYALAIRHRIPEGIYSAWTTPVLLHDLLTRLKQARRVVR